MTADTTISCISDCGCAGAQPASKCEFIPMCPACRREIEQRAINTHHFIDQQWLAAEVRQAKALRQRADHANRVAKALGTIGWRWLEYSTFNVPWQHAIRRYWMHVDLRAKRTGLEDE